MSIRGYLEVSGCCHAQKPSVLDTSVIYLFIRVEWLHFLLLSLPFPIYKMGINGTCSQRAITGIGQDNALRALLTLLTLREHATTECSMATGTEQSPKVEVTAGVPGIGSSCRIQPWSPSLDKEPRPRRRRSSAQPARPGLAAPCKQRWPLR